MKFIWRKLEIGSVFSILVIEVVLVFGLLWFAENKIEKMLFGIGILLMLVYLRTSKICYLICLFVTGMMFTVCYSSIELLPLLYDSNSNQDIFTANSVWFKPQNEFCDPYSADAIMYTIFNKKKCIISSEGYYRDYAEALFKEVLRKDSIPQMVDHKNYMDNDKFEKIGVSLARNHVLLFTDIDKNTLFDNVTYVFVNPVNLESCTTAIFVNDDLGNIYIMAESEWVDE